MDPRHKQCIDEINRWIDSKIPVQINLGRLIMGGPVITSKTTTGFFLRLVFIYEKNTFESSEFYFDNSEDVNNVIRNYPQFIIFNSML